MQKLWSSSDATSGQNSNPWKQDMWFNAMSGYVMSAGLSSSPYIATDNEPHLVLT
jgi:hypothetical protein